MFLIGRPSNLDAEAVTPSVNAEAFYSMGVLCANHCGAPAAKGGQQLEPASGRAPKKQNLLRQPVLARLTP